jgi:7,8-dihydroneopterin aldolase/epimerase/oxygenase
MDNQLIPWTIEIRDLATRLRTEEGGWQAVRIGLSICALTPAVPQSIEECLNYQPICQWMLDEWPLRPPASLEARLLELAHFIFGYDARVERIEAAAGKDDIVLSRHEYETAEHMQSGAIPYARAA